MEEKERKQKYRMELLTGGMVLGLAMFVMLVLQYLMRNMPPGSIAGLLGLVSFAAMVAVLVIYGKRAAALCPPDERHPGGFTYGRAFGFSILMCLLSGVVYGAGYFVMAEAVDPVYFGQAVEQVAKIYVKSGLMTAEQAREAMGMMHNQLLVIFGHMMAMAMQGGFLALFTAAVVRYRRPYNPMPPLQ